MFSNEDLIFASGGCSNYRIPTMVVANDGTVLAFCNDRKDSITDYTAVISKKIPYTSGICIAEFDLKWLLS